MTTCQWAIESGPRDQLSVCDEPATDRRDGIELCATHLAVWWELTTLADEQPDDVPDWWDHSIE